MAEWEKKYVVCRFDRDLLRHSVDDDVEVRHFVKAKEVLNTEEEAVKETNRLNSLARSNDEYFWNSTKYYPKGRGEIEVSPHRESAQEPRSQRLSSGGDGDASAKFEVSIRFVSRQLSGKQFNQRFGVEGTINHTPKGDVVWGFRASHTSSRSLEGKTKELLHLLPSEMDLWKEIAEVARGEIFVGVFASQANFGIKMSEDLCSEIVARGLTLDFDIYCL